MPARTPEELAEFLKKMDDQLENALKRLRGARAEAKRQLAMPAALEANPEQKKGLIELLAKAGDVERTLKETTAKAKADVLSAYSAYVQLIEKASKGKLDPPS